MALLAECGLVWFSCVVCHQNCGSVACAKELLMWRRHKNKDTQAWSFGTCMRTHMLGCLEPTGTQHTCMACAQTSRFIHLLCSIYRIRFTLEGRQPCKTHKTVSPAYLPHVSLPTTTTTTTANTHTQAVHAKAAQHQPASQPAVMPSSNSRFSLSLTFTFNPSCVAGGQPSAPIFMRNGRFLGILSC